MEEDREKRKKGHRGLTWSKQRWLLKFPFFIYFCSAYLCFSAALEFRESVGGDTAIMSYIHDLAVKVINYMCLLILTVISPVFLPSRACHCCCYYCFCRYSCRLLIVVVIVL